jgi:hypothetical protein
MENEYFHTCQCSLCVTSSNNPTREIHRAMNSLFAQLDAQQKALYIGLEAKKRGEGSERGLSLILGWSEEAIAVARRELDKFTTPENDSAKDAAACDEDYEQARSYDAKLACAQAYQVKIDRQPTNRGYYK